MSRPLSATKLAHFSTLLQTQREELAHQLAGLETTIANIRDARADTLTDDEHDPEGPTMSFEWGRVSALHADDAEQLSAIDSALDRIGAGTYGLCLTCGEPISSARLDARPSADLCIECALRTEAAR